jgi:urea transport system permease protein
VAAAFSAIGGAMFTLQVGFMSPTFVGIVPSIEMVIYCAVGGRLSIYGAIYGTLLVNWAKTSLSESFPELWLLGLGALFIAVVMFFPKGIAGIVGNIRTRFKKNPTEPDTVSTQDAGGLTTSSTSSNADTATVTATARTTTAAARSAPAPQET